MIHPIQRQAEIHEEHEYARIRNVRIYRRAQELMRMYPVLPCTSCGTALVAQCIGTHEGALVFSPFPCSNCGQRAGIHLLQRDPPRIVKETETCPADPPRYWWERPDNARRVDDTQFVITYEPHR